ncbi:GNAT family N-acetyltransferase [Cognatishimia sp. WU-CL00825]|uniref:GNAT family N-acetyltransferase n=1 Tax=Cognatishimia sp. WU-CL00825 TaxID=3127658 RepID=UPI00310BC8DC
MTLPSIQTLYQVTEATWPPAAGSSAHGFTIRDGQGGGKRVSAATLEIDLSQADVAGAEQAMRQLKQTPLFQVRAGEEALDAQLAQRGYQIIDPVNIYAAPASDIATELPPRTIAIPAWEPLKIMEEIWEAGGIGPGRIKVMHRATSPKTGFLSRFNDAPAGTAFAAMSDGITMLHALEILPSQRRNGLARWAMRRAAYWTLDNGGHTLSVICTQANDAANGLYLSLGMHLIGQYHYRIKPE